MAEEPIDFPRLLDRILDANQLDDGGREHRAEVVALLVNAVQALDSSARTAKEVDPALQVRLNQLRSTIDWLQTMNQVYSPSEWRIHVRRAVRDAQSLYEILEQRPNS